MRRVMFTIGFAIAVSVYLMMVHASFVDAREPLPHPAGFRIIGERPLYGDVPQWLNFDGNVMHYTIHPSNMDPYQTIRSVDNGK